MEKNLLIELLETGEKVSLYSPRFEGEEYTEFEKFLLTYKDQYAQDVQILIRRIDIIKENGAEDRFFRYEGSKRDRVMALPSHLDTSNLRLYCLNISHKILILGNGGIKKTQTYQEDVNLHRAVRNLQKIDIIIKKLENNVGIVSFVEHEGNFLTSEFDKANKENAQEYIRKIEERLGGKLNRETLEIEKPAFEIGKLYVFNEEDEDGELKQGKTFFAYYFYNFA